MPSFVSMTLFLAVTTAACSAAALPLVAYASAPLNLLRIGDSHIWTLGVPSQRLQLISNALHEPQFAYQWLGAELPLVHVAPQWLVQSPGAVSVVYPAGVIPSGVVPSVDVRSSVDDDDVENATDDGQWKPDVNDDDGQWKPDANEDDGQWKEDADEGQSKEEQTEQPEIEASTAETDDGDREEVDNDQSDDADSTASAESALKYKI